jgi:hypothetical protein
MNFLVEYLWLRLHAMLLELAEKLVRGDPSLLQEIGRTSNEAFLLRGFVSFKRSAEGDEISIAIDVQSTDQQIVIVSDACASDGRIVFDGPSAKIGFSDSVETSERAIDDWLYEFEQSLMRNEPKLVEEVSRLT